MKISQSTDSKEWGGGGGGGGGGGRGGGGLCLFLPIRNVTAVRVCDMAKGVSTTMT